MSSGKLDKKLVKEGNQQDYPKKGDTVAMNYTGWLYDAGAENNRGSQSVRSSQPLCQILIPEGSIAPKDAATSRPRLGLAESFKVGACWLTFV
jgi:hypothetical protein